MVTTRRATDSDKAFLWNLKVVTMRQYVEQVYGWDDATQYGYFENNFHPEALEIIQYERQDVGMYKLQKREEEWYLAQIEITPDFQNKGIGSTIIHRIIDDAALTNQPLRLQVLKVNPARRLYERMGFVETGESTTHIEMELPKLLYPSQAQPSWWQRIFRRVVSTRPGAWFASNTGHRIDRLSFRLFNGRSLFSTFLTGLPIVMLTVEGAKSKRLFTIPLVGIPVEDRIVLVASNWGGSRHPAWYHNMLANPEVTLTIQDQTKEYVSHEATGAERELYWPTVVDLYPGYVNYKERTGERQIPIMVLEPMCGYSS